MEAALATVLAGLVDKPIIAVPTSGLRGQILVASPLSYQ